MRVVKIAASSVVLWVLPVTSSISVAAASPQISLSATTGQPGTSVTISGTGFPAGEIVALYIDSPNPYLGQPGPRADGNGAFQLTFQWPGQGFDPAKKVDPSKPGTHQVCGDTTWPGSDQTSAVKACTQFTALPGPSPTPSPRASPAPRPGLTPTSILIVIAVMAVVGAGTYFIQRRISG